MSKILTLYQFLKRRNRPARRQYDPDTEKDPTTQYFAMPKEEIDKKRKNMLKQVLAVLEPADEHDPELFRLQQDLPVLMENVPRSRSILIAIVGHQGIGKSSLLNALLHKYNIAATSSAGSSCTSFVTIYEYRPGTGNSERINDVETHYMDVNFCVKLLTELICDYNRFHFLKDETDIDFAEEQARADSAREILDLVFDTANSARGAKRLKKLLTPKNIENETATRVCGPGEKAYKRCWGR